MTTPNIGLELPARGASGWEQTLNQNFSRIDGAFGGLSSLWANAPEAYTASGTFNGTTGVTLNLPRTVSSISDYAVTVTPRTASPSVGVIAVEKGLSSFVVKCSGGDTTTTFDAVVWFAGDVSPQGVKVQGRSYPALAVADHANPATPGSLAALLASVGSTPAVIEFIGNTTYQITGADLTVPANVALRFQPGAVLSVASGRTLTINGHIEAGPWQIFSGSGTIGGLREARPEWFGAVPDGSTDCTAALQKAFASLADTSGIINLSAGQYVLSSTVTVGKNGWTLKGVARAGKTFATGAGYQASYIKIATMSGPALDITAYGSYPSRGWTIADISFEGNSASRPTCDAVIKITSGDQGTIRDVDFQNIAGRAIWTIRCVKSAFRNIDIYTCGDTGKPALDLNYSGSNITQGCHFSDIRVESCINAPYINIASGAQQLHFTNLGFEASPSVTGSGQSYMAIHGTGHVVSNIHMNQNAGTSPRIVITGSFNTISNIASAGTHGASDIQINGGSYNVIANGSFVASGSGEDFYAITITGSAWYNRISNVIFRSIGGVYSDSAGSGNVIDGCTQYQGRMAFVTSTANVTEVLNCYCDGLAQTTGAPAISLGGTYSVIKNCHIRNSTTATIGINVTGSTPVVRDNEIVNLTASNAVGIKVGGNYASVTGNLISTVSGHGIQVGDETSSAIPVMCISNNSITGVGASAYAIALMATADVTDGGVISGNRIRGTASKSIYITDNAGAPRYKNLSIFGNNIYGGSSLSIPVAGPNAANFDALGYGSVASASTITLPDTSNTINVTGTTGITNITASWRGRIVTLIFAGTLTVTDGGNLRLAGNLNTSANTTLTLVCDGAAWYEIARSVN